MLLPLLPPLWTKIALYSPCILHIETLMNPALFSNELEYLYTVQGFSKAFEFLFKRLGRSFESRLSELQPEAMQTSFERTSSLCGVRVYALISESPSLATFLLHTTAHTSTPLSSLGQNQSPSKLMNPALRLSLLHYSLQPRFTLHWNPYLLQQKYDMNTAFAILRSATYLSLDDKIQALFRK
jgi:hypothetical protein